MDYSKMLEIIDLEEKYRNLLGVDNNYPIEYYNINDLDLKKRVIEEAINTKTRLEDLEIIKQLHLYRIDSIIDDTVQKHIR